MKGFLSRFSMFDLIIIAMMSALGIATKPVVVPLAHIITGPLYIPGGAIAGGFYMMWIVLGAGFVEKKGAATLVALVQAIMIIVTGAYGTHGIVSIVTYTLPGFMVDILLFIIRKKGSGLLDCFLGGIVANLSGTFLSNIVFFKLPIIPLILSLSSAALSGGLGGIIAYNIISKFEKLSILNVNK
ncbi:ECF transporter S component [Wukongibacter sp. M2B1]|uniref:ECF transporter S component n=1 Tax=Wukongibacter sp. M2B1 TaxID=3088895 RepID=UPI003D7AC932